MVVPAAVAVTLSRRDGRLAELLGRCRPRGHPGWWVAAALAGLVPTLLTGLRLGPPPGLAPAGAAGLAALYLAGAFGEELGWVGYAQPLARRLTGSVAGTAAVVAGIWLAWHLVPFVETGHDAGWVAGQCLQLVLMRFLIVGLVEAARAGVGPAVVLHAASNLAWSLGSPEAYDPWLVSAALVPLAMAALVAGALRSDRPGPGAAGDEAAGGPGPNRRD